MTHNGIAAWLNDPGLEQFRDALVEQQVELEELPELNEQPGRNKRSALRRMGTSARNSQQDSPDSIGLRSANPA